MALVFLISNFFINKNSQGRKLSAKKIPTFGNSALGNVHKCSRSLTSSHLKRIYKAELPQEGILFRTQFPSLGIFINKKVGFRKN